MTRSTARTLARLLLVGMISSGTAFARADESALDYPNTRRTEHVDIYHGTQVPDPYRWLEDDVRVSEDVADWVDRQRSFTREYLDALPGREALTKRLTQLWDYEKYSTPFKDGGRYYYAKNDGLQNQSVYYRLDTLDAEPQVLLDPNTWSDDGTVALAGLAFSDDGKYIAYGIAESGSDWRTWHIMEIESGRKLEDEIQNVKFSSVEWTADGKGFFYGRYERPDEGEAYQALNLNQKVYYHRVGTSQDSDVLAYHRPEHPEWTFGLEVTEDGRYLVISIRKGTDDKHRIVYKDLEEPYGLPIELIDNFDNEYNFVANEGPVFYFQTDLEAPRKRLIAIDIREPQRDAWREIIPQADETTTSINMVGNMLVARRLKDAQTQVVMYSPDGEQVREVEFPGIGSASGFSGRRTDTETFYTFSSFATPPSNYRYDMITGESTRVHEAEVDFNPEDYVVKQVFYESADGTRIPMFIAHRQGIELDGNNPTLLYGYGGFAISLTPGFSTSRLAWMEMGGVYAQPNLRGGGEYGESWHQAGAKLNKQNVFDDFIAAAEWLIENKYTRPEKLAIEGRSNGGLLVGAVMTQRPELFGACLPAVGVMDMLRFHQFTAGRFWVDDYGSADNPEQFRALLEYSPYHNLESGKEYPPTLVSTADTDDRVVPGHSFKFAAALQHAQAGDAPVLISIQSRAGHGAGKPTEKIIEELADTFLFLVQHLDMPVPEPPEAAGQ
ncbi:MAG: prolyl oligopeptidase family serine peptidase [Pirellulales bacterium]